MKLDAEQLKVVGHRGGPALVLAGPGSGKTATLVERARALLEEGVPSRELALVTFTQKAAQEMRRRLGEEAREAFVGTIHALALRILLLRRRLRPLSEEEEEALLRERWNLDGEILRAWRRGRKEEAALKAGLGREELERRLAAHEADLAEEGLIPLALLVREADRLLGEDEEAAAWAQARCRHLIVDEFQDTDTEELLFLARLAPPPEADFMAVGDVDQSIYGWRGAEPQVVEVFREIYRPREYRLLTNYRAPERLVALASKLTGKRLTAVRPGGEYEVREFENPWAEADWVAREAARLVEGGTPPEEVAVLVRSGQQIPPLEEALLRHRLAYSLAGGVALERRREVRLFLALLRGATLGGSPPDPGMALQLVELLPGLGAGFARRLVREWREGEALSALLHRLAEGLPASKAEGVRWLAGALEVLEALWEEPESLGEVVAASLEVVAEELLKAFARWRGSSPEDRLRRLKRMPALAEEWRQTRPEGVPARLFPHAFFLGPGEGGGVRLSTVHAAKGLEWQAVFVPGLVEGVFPVLGKGADLEEEKRLLYVAITRAKERLYLSTFRRSLTGKPVGRSRFLDLLFPKPQAAAV